jgi:chemotaxis protein CheX
MNVKFLNPFIDAAYEVLLADTGISMKRGDLGLETEAYVTDDVTVIISLIGRVEGNVFFSMNEQSALDLVSQMLGEKQSSFDNLVQSGVAELGNVITGQASVKLAQAGYASTISPPTLLRGKGAVISTLDYPRLIVPLNNGHCRMVVHLALRENANSNFSPAKTPVSPAPSIV